MRCAYVLPLVLVWVAGCVAEPEVAEKDEPRVRWQIMTIAGPGSVGTGKNAIAVDAQGVPHVAYRSGDSLHYARRTDGKWRTEEVVSGCFIGRNVVAPDIALDATEKPVITYGLRGLASYGGVCVARKNDKGRWVRETIATKGNFGRFTAVDVAGDTVHAAYLDYKKQDDLHYAVRRNGTWRRAVVAFYPNAGFFCDLEVDAEGHPHIVYATVEGGYEGIDFTSDDYVADDLKYATWDGTRWTHDTIDTYGHVGYWPGLRIDVRGIPHVSYVAENEVKYAVNLKGSWTVRVADSGKDIGKFSALALDRDTRPWIAYTRGRKLKLAHWTGSAWEHELVDVAGDVGANCAMEIDTRDGIHIVYTDRTHKDLKYAYHAGAPQESREE